MDSNKQIELEVQVHLAEYQKVRDEIVHHLNTANQTWVLSLGTASIAIPLVVSQVSSLPQELIAAILYTLGLIYSVVGMEYVRASYYANSESNYIHKELSPKLNSKLHTEPKSKVLQLDVFNRQSRSNAIAFYLSSVGPIGVSVLIMFPSLVALLAARFISLTSFSNAFPTSPALPFLISVLNPLSIIAWGAFFLSSLAQIFSVIYSFTTDYVVRRNGQP